MIEAFRLDRVTQIAGEGLVIATHISEEDLAVTAQVPLYPAVFDHVNGVRIGDTRYSPAYRELSDRVSEFAVAGIELDRTNPDTLMDSARNKVESSEVLARIVAEHSQFVMEKGQIIRDLRAETISASEFTTSKVEQIEDGELIPLFAQEGQLIALGLDRLQVDRDLRRGGALLTATRDTRLIVVTDTSESLTANYDRYVEHDPANLPAEFNPLDPEHHRSLEAEEVAELLRFNETTYRVLPNIRRVLPELIKLQRWR